MKRLLILFVLAAVGLTAGSPDYTIRGEVEFVIRIVEASSDPSTPNDAADVVPAELKSILRLDRYTQVGIAILRGKEIEFDLGGIVGDIESRILQQGGEAIIEFEIEVEGPPENPEDDHDDRTTIIETTATAKDGETVVLGASKAPGGTNAMIVLLTAKIVR